ncbi:uncharacterized protein il12rb1 [Stigmatopora nigra]
METLNWNTLLRYIAAWLIFPTTTSKGSECEAPSHLQCYRRNRTMSVYNCEWRMNTTQKNVTFHLHTRKGPFYKVFPSGILETSIEINAEDLIQYSPVVIWVEAHVGDSVCMSTNASVTLNETVKHNAPENISVTRFQNHLNLTWKASENYPALAEVLIKDYASKRWEKRYNRTEFVHNKMTYHLIVENLQKQTCYHLKVRQKPTGCRNPLWSDWSQLVIVPAVLEDELEVNMTYKNVEGSRKVKLTWKPVHYAATVPEVKYTVRITQFSGGCSCTEKKAYTTNRTEYMDYVSYSPVNFTVIATNAAGSSPPAIVQISTEAVDNLKTCNNTLMDKKINNCTCLEWYMFQDGNLELIARKTKGDMKSFEKSKLLHFQKRAFYQFVILGIKDYVEYTYFEHLCVNERPKTVNMCLYYKQENVSHTFLSVLLSSPTNKFLPVPKVAPPDFFAFNETQSSVRLSWKTIPKEDRQGFVTHYNLCSVQLNAKDERHQCHIIGPSIVEYQLDNLRPGRKYNITIAGVTSIGEGPKATVIFSTMNSRKEWLNLGLAMVFFLFIFLIFGTCIWKRMKKKILPPVPMTPILDFDTQQNLPWDMLEVKEIRVHDVTVQQLHPKGHTQNEDEHDDDEQSNTHIQLTTLSDHEALKPLRGPENAEIPIMEQEDMLGLFLYSKGLVFEKRTDEC